MRKKLFTLLLATVASIGTLFASDTQVDGIWYDFNSSTLTVSVTYRGSMNNSYSNEYSGSVNIPSSVEYNGKTYSVTSIGSCAFYGCTGLTSVTIPNSVTSIGRYAFENCSGLTSIEIPNSVTSIEYSAFNGCSRLTSVTWNAENCHVSSLDPPFDGISSRITSFIFGEGVKSIPSYLCMNMSNLKEITIPNSVTSIGYSAFSGCSSLTSVTIPNSVTSIEYEAFSNVPNIMYSGSATGSPWGARSINGYVDGYWVYSDNTKTTLLACSAAAQGEIIIPNSVTSIGDYAFYDCSAMTSVTISNSVTSIGNYAFRGSGLTSVTIPNSVTSIGGSAFSRCTGLTSVTIPNSVTSIRGNTFYYCTGLTSVTIGNSVTSIGYEAFRECSRLTSVTIPNSVTSIGEAAFCRCSNLKLINVEAITPPITPPQSASFPFTNIHSDAVFYVPYGSLNAYKTTSNWKNYNVHVINLSHASSSSGATSVTITLGDKDEAKHIVACGMEGGEEEFAGNVIEYIGLEPYSEYANIPLFIKTEEGDTDNTTVSFTTTALELTTKASKPVSGTTAILLAETNMSDAEINCGFEYKRNDAPADMEGNKVYCPVASGQMAGRLKGLKDDVYYKYRAFYQSAAGNMYYGDWQYIFTGDVAVEFDPILYTYGATVVRENEATISGYALAGSEDFTEQGFEYWAESRVNGQSDQVPSTKGTPRRMPAALNEHFFVQASGIALRATLTNLDAGTVYKYRVYGKVGDQYYYGAEQSFATSGTYTPPTYIVTFANWDGAVLQSSQVEDGKMPIYSGETPVRPEDEQYTYTFSGWTPQIVAATADATYTAQYVAKDKHEGLEDIQEDNIPCTKVVRDGQIFILRGEKEYTLTGQEVR